jgi:hypothetical protein
VEAVCQPKIQHTRIPLNPESRILDPRGRYDDERKAFVAAWNDRSLDVSDTQNMLKAWIHSLGAPIRWLRGKKKVVTVDPEEEERRRKAEREEERKRKAAFMVQLRPLEQRVKPSFITR